MPPENAGMPASCISTAYLFPHLTVQENVRVRRDATCAYADAMPTRIRSDRALCAPGARAIGRRAAARRDRARAGAQAEGAAARRAVQRAGSAATRTLVRRIVARDHARAGDHRAPGDARLHRGRAARRRRDPDRCRDACCSTGRPERLFREPASPYIAEFLGAENVYAGEVRHLDDAAPDWLGWRGRSCSRADITRSSSCPEALTLYTVGDAPPGPGHAVIRAEEVLIWPRRPCRASARNQFRGSVSEIATTGALTRVTVDVSSGDGEVVAPRVPIVAALTTRSAQELELREGSDVWALFKAMAVHLC